MLTGGGGEHERADDEWVQVPAAGLTDEWTEVTGATA